MEWWCHTLELYWASHVRFFLSRLEIYSMWLERARPANQHPKNTIKKKKNTMLCTSWISQKMCDTRTCYFDYRINKPSAHSRCMICSSCSVLLISTYYILYIDYHCIKIKLKTTLIHCTSSAVLTTRCLDFFLWTLCTLLCLVRNCPWAVLESCDLCPMVKLSSGCLSWVLSVTLPSLYFFDCKSECHLGRSSCLHCFVPLSFLSLYWPNCAVLVLVSSRWKVFFSLYFSAMLKSTKANVYIGH